MKKKCLFWHVITHDNVHLQVYGIQKSMHVNSLYWLEYSFIQPTGINLCTYTSDYTCLYAYVCKLSSFLLSSLNEGLGLFYAPKCCSKTRTQTQQCAWIHWLKQIRGIKKIKKCYIISAHVHDLRRLAFCCSNVALGLSLMCYHCSMSSLARPLA